MRNLTLRTHDALKNDKEYYQQTCHTDMRVKKPPGLGGGREGADLDLTGVLFQADSFLHKQKPNESRKLKGLRLNSMSGWCPYLDDAAPAGRRLHRLQQDGVGVLAAAGEDDAAAPAAGRSRRDEVRRSVAAQPVSTSIALRHVDEEEVGSVRNNREENQSSRRIGPE